MSGLRLVLIALVLIISTAAGQAADGVRRGSSAEITVYQPEGQPVVIEVRTEAERTGHQELFVWMMPQAVGRKGAERMIVPPVEPGLYRLERVFTPPGEWRLTFRHGIGLDVYYTGIQLHVTPQGAEPMVFTRRFQPDLAESAPTYLQPLGFGILGMIAAFTLLLLVVTLRRLKRRFALTA